VQFSAELRDRVASGRITVSYRLWSRPKVKVGGAYRSGAATIDIDELELVPFSSITDDDLARTGEPDLESLRRRAGARRADRRRNAGLPGRVPPASGCEREAAVLAAFTAPAAGPDLRILPVA